MLRGKANSKYSDQRGDSGMIINRMLAAIEDVSSLTVTVSSTTYNGSVKSLQNLIAVTYNGEILTSTDYELSGTIYATNAGSYSATLIGKGRFTGSRAVQWSITQARLKPSNRTVTFDGVTEYSGATPSSGNVDVYVHNLGTNNSVVVKCSITLDYTPADQTDTINAMISNVYTVSGTRTAIQSQVENKTYWNEATISFSNTSGYSELTISFWTKNYTGSQTFHIYAS